MRCPESANTIWLPLIAAVVAAADKNIAAMIVLF
jgi:hypothetical protein